MKGKTVKRSEQERIAADVEQLANIYRELEGFVNDVGMGTVLAMVSTILSDREAASVSGQMVE